MSKRAREQRPVPAASRDDSDLEAETSLSHSGDMEGKMATTESSGNESDDDGPGGKSAPGPQTKRAKKAITALDVQVARETAELFKSNIFKLQIDELVGELRLKEAHTAVVEQVLHRLHGIIQEIPETKDLTLEEAESVFTKSKIAIPFPDPKPAKVNYKFGFKSPEQVSLVGSFGLKTGINNPEGVSVDMALTMPKSLFQPKDYLNYRALYKRAFYLAYVCEHVTVLAKKNNLPIKLSYEYLNGDILCPVLRIESVNTKKDSDLIFTKTRISIKLIVGFPIGIFESKKLIPDRNCIRIQVPDDEKDLPPTPLYNSSILSSTAYEYYLKYLYTSKKSAEAFRDACALGKLWLSQRGFDSSFQNGGFGHFEFAMLMSALLQGGGVNGNKILLHGFSSYQLFKGTIKYLATQDLSQKGYLSFSSLIGEVNSVYKESNPNFLTFFDKNTKINLLWKMTRSSYEILQKFANETLVLLNDVVYDRFDPIFLKKLKTDELTFDIVLRLPLSQFGDSKDFGPVQKISFLSFEHFIKTKIYKILKRALGDRAKAISVKLSAPSNSNRFSITKRKPTAELDNSEIVVGLFLNAGEAEKLVTKGPDNEDEEAAIQFRHFWGSKASLRRFKDGSIQHCCIWENSSSEPVVLEIVKYICKKHLFNDEKEAEINSNVTKFQSLLPQSLLPAAKKQSVLSTHSFQALRASFDALCKVISSADLPLAVRSITPVSPALRLSSLLQPVPFAVSNPDFFNEVVLQFETSTNWPDELTAVEKTKTAFLLKIQEFLHAQTEYKTMFTKDSSIPIVDSVVTLNVLSPEGYGFKIRVLSERDEVLYLRAIENANEREKPYLKDAYLKFNQKYIASIKHQRTVTIMAHHFPFYSATVRLFKRWLDSQLLLSHFNEEVIELLVLKVFVDPAPYSVPGSVEAAFLRVLDFLSSWNWREYPVILDLSKTDEVESDELMTKLSDKLSIPTFQLINSNFEAIRKQDPLGSKVQFFVGSKDDHSGIIWTSGLSLPMCSRLTAISKVAMNLLRSAPVDGHLVDLLFTPAVKDFDFVLHLKVPFKLDSLSGVLPPSSFKNLVSLSAYPEDFKFDPTLKYVAELKKKMGNVIIFSSHKYTGLVANGDENLITGLFVPTTLAERKFKVDQGFNFKPVADSQVVLNRDAIISEIYRLGGDLVKSADWK